MEEVDVVVIGAGLHGLPCAKTYLECHPLARLLVLESAPTLGGVWAEHRLYEGLKTNNLFGTYEYSDFPMYPGRYRMKSGQHIPGNTVHRYLEDYARAFDIYKHIRFSCRVETAEQQTNGTWLLTISDRTIKVLTAKLILATGLTSEPSLPRFERQECFDSPIIHVKDMAKFPSSNFGSSSRIVVFGGTKSAWDAVYLYASSGIPVDWVIRESGHGPAWMRSIYVTPFRIWIERVVNTRFITWFSPCIWGDADGFTWIRWLLHCTTIGRWIVNLFWSVFRAEMEHSNGYDLHPETAKLKPWVSPFWVAVTMGILNYPTNIFELVRSGIVTVHIADITHLTSHYVHLSSGASLHADILVCSTGWKAKPPITFLPEGIDRTLGLPGTVSPKSLQNPMIVEADRHILSRFPQISPRVEQSEACLPLFGDFRQAPEEPCRLWRFMVPPALVQSRSIVICGMLQTYSAPLVAQLQALWVTAYLDGSLSLPSLLKGTYSHADDGLQVDSHLPASETERRVDLVRHEHPRPTTLEEQAEWEAVLYTQFCRWRYPAAFSSRHPDFVLDTIPYMDMLLKDLGLRYRRKNTLWKECLQPYRQEDYKGLVDEWRTTRGQPVS